MAKDIQDFTALVGKIAVTDTALDPRGTATIDGEVYEVESEAGYVDTGRGVRITRVKGRKIFVRRV
ncbi:MAG: NfeD family protein [Treponema sp.]|nr:NfeD family protein [Treponema sp.]